MDAYKSWTEREMAKFDSLSPEMRELVRKYGQKPKPKETPEQYQNDMNKLFPEGVI